MQEPYLLPTAAVRAATVHGQQAPVEGPGARLGCGPVGLSHLQQLDVEISRLGHHDRHNTEQLHTHISRLQQELRDLKQACTQQTQQLVAALSAKGRAATPPTHTTPQPHTNGDQHEASLQAPATTRIPAQRPRRSSSFVSAAAPHGPTSPARTAGVARPAHLPATPGATTVPAATPISQASAWFPPATTSLPAGRSAAQPASATARRATMPAAAEPEATAAAAAAAMPMVVAAAVAVPKVTAAAAAGHRGTPAGVNAPKAAGAADRYPQWLLAMQDFKLDPCQVARHVGDLYSPDRGLSMPLQPGRPLQQQQQQQEQQEQQQGGPVAEGAEHHHHHHHHQEQQQSGPVAEGIGGRHSDELVGTDAKLFGHPDNMLLGLDMKLALAAQDKERIDGQLRRTFTKQLLTPDKPFHRRMLMLVYDVTCSVIEPSGTFRVRWDLLVMVMLAYICVVSPYTICFGTKTHLTEPTEMISQIINLLFVFDIYLNFRTAVQVDERTVMRDHKFIMRDYLRTWLIPDVLSVLPYDKLMTTPSYGFMRLMKATRVIKLAKVLRLLKVVKVMRVVRNSALIKQIQRMAGHHVFSIMYFITAAVFILHWIACLFYYAASLQDLSNETWVALMGLRHSPKVERYITALYWAMSTLTTVGYGDVTPGTSSEKIVAMLGMTIGVTIFGYFMGAMGSMLSQMNSLDDRVPKKMAKVEDFIRNRKIPDDLAERIRSFFSYILTRQLQGDEEGMISELSVPLRAEMVLFLYREALQKVPFFRDKDTQFIVAIVTCLRMEYFSPGDIVVRQGDPGNVMYFIGEGSLEVRLYFANTSASDLEDNPVLMNEIFCKPRFKASETPVSAKVHSMLQLNAPPLRTHQASLKRQGNNYIVIGRLEAGEYFGEYSCLLGECRSASVVAEDYCELYSLSRQDLDKVFEIWPEMAEEFQTLVEGYVPSDTAADAAEERPTTLKTNPLWTRWLSKSRQQAEGEDEDDRGSSVAAHEEEPLPDEEPPHQEPPSVDVPLEAVALATRAPRIAQGSFSEDVTNLLRRITADQIPQPQPRASEQPSFFGRSMSLSVGNSTLGGRSMRSGRTITALDPDVLAMMVRRVTSSKAMGSAAAAPPRRVCSDLAAAATVSDSEVSG